MQPTYLPWCGYFGLIQSVDLFILLDSVQFAKRSWQQRNRIKTPTGPSWLTVPVLSKGKRDQTISDVEIDIDRNHASSHIKSIATNYSRAAFFDQYGPDLLQEIANLEKHLADLNIRLIAHCCAALEISTPLVRASQMKSTGRRAELLANLCQEVGASEYISPLGSKDYLVESTAFEGVGIPIRYFAFEHPVYPQLFGHFEPYMSAIDLILNCGARSNQLIRGSTKPDLH